MVVSIVKISHEPMSLVLDANNWRPNAREGGLADRNVPTEGENQRTKTEAPIRANIKQGKLRSTRSARGGIRS